MEHQVATSTPRTEGGGAIGGNHAPVSPGGNQTCGDLLGNHRGDSNSAEQVIVTDRDCGGGTWGLFLSLPASLLCFPLAALSWKPCDMGSWVMNPGGPCPWTVESRAETGQVHTTANRLSTCVVSLDSISQPHENTAEASPEECESQLLTLNSFNSQSPFELSYSPTQGQIVSNGLCFVQMMPSKRMCKCSVSLNAESKTSFMGDSRKLEKCTHIWSKQANRSPEELIS